jgi:hypothetical protein
MWIHATAEKMSNTKLYWFVFIYKYFKRFLFRKNDVCIKNDLAIIPANVGNVEAVASMLEDEKSKHVYMSYIKGRLRKKITYFDIKEKEDNEYYISELKLGKSGPEVIVDAGAYTGDSVIRFNKILASSGGGG